MATQATEPPPFPGQQIIHACRLVHDRILSSKDGVSSEVSSLPLDPAQHALYAEICQLYMDQPVAAPRPPVNHHQRFMPRAAHDPSMDKELTPLQPMLGPGKAEL